MKKVVVLILWGLAFLLQSCEKEGGLEGLGEKVMVHISLGDVDYKGKETITRGYRSEMEAVRVPLSDGLFMFTTLEEDLEAPTRAGEPLADGVKVRVVAYQSSTVKGTGEYTVKSGMLVSENGSGFAVEEGTYTFVAYSYNSSTPPDYAEPTITVASPHDLLWGSHTQLVDASSSSVSITMDHLFAQVRVKATTTSVSGQPEITNMSGVTVTPGNSADLTIETGGVDPNTSAIAAALPVSWGDWSDGTEVTSDPVAIYTGTDNTIYVNIGSVTIDDYDTPFTNARATFNKALTAGYSYTLVVNFQKTLWAKSNIYWDVTNQRLTFDTHENSHQGYQGVLFRWGSLVGISPARAGSDAGFIYKPLPIYVPYGYPSTPKWKLTYPQSVDTDADIPGTSDYITWTTTASGGVAAPDTDIPYLDGRYTAPGTVAFGRNNRYVIDADRNTTEMYQSLRGDICQYLSTKTGVVSGDYRLPTSYEFGSISSGNSLDLDGWTTGGTNGTDLSLGNAYGTVDLLSLSRLWAKNSTMGDVIFPASGLRTGDGYLYNVGDAGYGWSGSGGTSIFGYILEFRIYYVYPYRSGTRSDAYPVRCVQN
jgi:hypothetical protein